jgi:hypothetical protein
LTIPWSELLKNRTPMVSVMNSAHMLECVDIVRAKFPMAVIEEAGKGLWRVVSEGEAISNPHSSHYECWIEARELMNVAD